MAASGKLEGAVAVTVEADEWEALAGSSPTEKLKSALAANRVVVFGRSTCPFCIEVSRTLVELGVPFAYHQIDQMAGGVALHEELKKATGQRTVPYVYINGRLVGGCDATKALIASGEFDTLLGGGGGSAGGGEKEALLDEGPPRIKLAGVDRDAPLVIGALFEFPNTVDGRVIRLVALQVFFISLFLAIFSYKKEQAWHWVAVGLLVDFCLRFYAGAGISPLGSLAMLAASAIDLIGSWTGRETGPVWGAGPPKQFAVSVGIIFSAAIVVLQFCHAWQAATVVAACLCFAAGLECFVNFCAGCWLFQKAIRFGVIPDTIYTVHVNTLPETKYMWKEWVKRVHPAAPVEVTERFAPNLRPGGKPTRVDLRYKTGKSDDWEREAFDYVKYSKMSFFSAVIGPVAVAALFRFTAIIPTMGTPDLVWKVLALLSLVWTAIFLLPCLLKCVKYPHKIRQEWQHPMMNNAFSVPWMTLVVYSFLAAHYSLTFAKVLFWAGASLSMLFSVMIVGNWLASMRHEGLVNGAFMMAPVGNFIVAVMGPLLDSGYHEVCYLWFGFAFIMWIALFVFTFQRTVLGHNANPRGRMFSIIWVAAPAVAAIAWTVLNAARTAAKANPGLGGEALTAAMFGVLLDPVSGGMDATAMTLFYVAVSLGLVNVWMAWRRFLWADKFFMQMWAFGFPTAGLAWAAVLYDMTVNTALSKVLAVCLIALACIICVVLVLRTCAGILRLKVFIPEHKWGPMSHLPLAQEGLRHLLDQLCDSASALAADPSNTRVALRLSEQWRAFRTINDFYLTLKDEVCFPQISAFFPGHHAKAMAQNQEMRQLEGEVAAQLRGLAAGGGTEGATGSGIADTCADVDKWEGTTLADKLAAATATNQIVVVGRSTCPFCIEVTRTLTDMGLSFPYLLVDKMPSGAALHEELKKVTGQRTVPYVYANGKLLGGCDATKALIASGQFDTLLGGGRQGGANGKNANGKAANSAALQAAVARLASFAKANYDYVEDHIRPVVRRYIPGTVQKKIMNDCFDARPAEEWFQVVPLVVQALPMMGQRATYVRCFLWAMPERCQQFGIMLALGTDPVTWYRLRRLVPDIIPRGEAGWRHF
ncbi:C4-dicarboxylate ABC transporter [Micractinium conductrix]|uniref:C4-dicarboxylate ABC transporter n=1 Tax=Micractinium conductrix TaxID=554055 RepID=A0A2P6V7Q3_9CHLO|nr:C4-dicarboxylate ABC transporter [Micractinium conductrix]|eukprot:PSC70111.1 C4-dicarboxylate ABC transporter [Micractinium conductrix]